MPKYETMWKEFDLNQGFWREVLVGRTIADITFDDHGIATLVLDNDEIIYLPKDLEGGRIFIKAERRKTT